MALAVRRVVLCCAVALLGLATATFARASIDALATLESGAFAPSAIPALLGPVAAAGRNAWDCVPERTAATQRVRDADLPVEHDN